MLILTKSGNKYLFVSSLLLLLIIMHCILLAAFEGILYFMKLLPTGLWLSGLLFILLDTSFVFLLMYYKSFIKNKSANFLISALFGLSIVLLVVLSSDLMSEDLVLHRIGLIILISLTFLPPIGFVSSFLIWWSRTNISKAKNIPIN